VFDAPAKFHLFHVESVINELVKSGWESYKIIVICSENTIKHHDNITYLTHIEQLSFWQKIDLFITTEFYRELPFWLTASTVFFGHGIGPKLNYQTQELLAPFNFIFSPCTSMYNVQVNLFPAEHILKIGLPMLDNVTSNSAKLNKHFNLKSELPTLVYAPSWSLHTELIADIPHILCILENIKDINIIISPHPLLLQPDRCNNIDYFGELEAFENIKFNLPSSNITTLEAVNNADVVISDISSILFEAMALNKIVMLEDNRAMFEKYEAGHVFDAAAEACQLVDWHNFDPQLLSSAIKKDPFAEKRLTYINNYLYNNGNATNAFIDALNDLLKKNNYH
jgi:hypothetical protein